MEVQFFSTFSFFFLRASFGLARAISPMVDARLLYGGISLSWSRISSSAAAWRHAVQETPPKENAWEISKSERKRKKNPLHFHSREFAVCTPPKKTPQKKHVPLKGTWYRRLIIALVSVFVILPASSFRDISAIERLSAFSVFTVIMIIGIVGYTYTNSRLLLNDYDFDEHVPTDISWWIEGPEFLPALG